MATIQNDDLFLVGRGTESYTIKYEDLLENIGPVPPSGTIDTPTVLSPQDGAGSGEERYAESDTITKVDAAGENVYTTDTIASVSNASYTYVSSSSVTDPENAFDGDDSTYAEYGNVNSVIVFSTSASDVRMTIRNDSSSAAQTVAVFLSDGTTPAGSFASTGGNTLSPSLATTVTDTFTFSLASSSYVLKQTAGTTKNIRVYSMSPPEIILTFPEGATHFDKFEKGDVVQTTAPELYTYTQNVGNNAIPTISGMDPRGTVTSLDNVGGTINGVSVPGIVRGTSVCIGYGDGRDIVFNATVPWSDTPTYGTNNNGSTWTDLSQAVSGTGTQTFSGYDYIVWNVQGGNGIEFTVNSVDATITAIDAAGPTITVDGGSWLGADGSGDTGNPDWYEPSQEWSSYTQGGANAASKTLFDGNVTTYSGYVYDITIPAGSEPSFTKIEVMFDTDAVFDNIFAINGVNTVPAQAGNPGNTWIDVTSLVGAGDLSTIVSSGGDSATAALAIRLDGKLLVDSSVPGGQGDTDITKTTAYSTKLTVASDKDLDDMSGAVYMTDGQTEADGTFKPASYTLQTSEIASVSADANPVLTFNSPNPDLKYFQVGDQLSATKTGEANNFLSWGTTTSTVTGAENVFDGDISTVALWKHNTNTGGHTYGPSWTFSDTPVTVELDEIFMYRLDRPTNNEKGKWNSLYTINGNSYVPTNFSRKPTGESGTWVSIQGNEIYNDNVIVSIGGYLSIIAGTTQYAAGSVVVCDSITLDVKRIVGNTMEVPVEVISTDTTANTMTVDGGAWADSSDSYFAAFSSQRFTGPNFTSSSVTGLTYDQDAESGVSVSSSQTLILKNTATNIIGTENYHVYTSTNGTNWTRVAEGVPGNTATDNVASPYIAVVSDNAVAMTTRAEPYGDTSVTLGPFTAEGTIASVDGTEVDLSASSGRWIADNKAGIDFSISGPAVIDNPLLTADVELESSLFATTPVGADTLNNIVWELNGVEQNAGTTNPYKPTLSTDTSYTVRVKHQGNALPESGWSASTTFTTGSTRNLYTYQQDRIAILMTRVAALEADHASMMNNNNSGY